MTYRTASLKRQKDSLVNDASPAPINPFTELRNSLNLSHARLAEICFVSKQALIRLEQGTFSDPLPSVVDYYVHNHDQSELHLRDAYIAFQEATRKRYANLFGDNLSVDVTAPDHPLRQLRYRKKLNPTELAKMLCIPQATLDHFEKKWKTQQSVPKQLCAALFQLNYPSSAVEEFKKSYAAWRSFQLTR